MNKLIHETSPYLLQHAHNPVDWHPWGDEALNLAKSGDKPILVSIGYSACHWCHVMERESFENETTAALMNECFINIKIDREERPDLDHIYMDAVQNMTGSGGWPLNVFLTPEGKPFYGGTYFPPKRAYNRASWQEVLKAVYDAYKNKKDEVLAQAENLTSHLANANNFGITKQGANEYGSLFSRESLASVADNLLKQADTVWGGFGAAPKFPQTFSIQFLLRHHYFTGNQAAADQALLSIDKMTQGGIYDQLGGGFARYSTDGEWLAPHFEKMLYDNALLLSVISEAYQLTGQQRYKETINQTIGFIESEMRSSPNGFYSALDADSEGVEGKYYVWSKNEVDEILGTDSELFCTVYGITERGNWEHNNILWLQRQLEEKIKTLDISEITATEILKACREKLFVARGKRARPGLDDKILTGWNALMISACCKAYAATGYKRYLGLAEDCMFFLEDKCRHEGWKHTYKNGMAKFPAFLDDCAYIIQAYLNLQTVTGNSGYLEKAKQLTEHVLNTFSDEDGLYFYFTPVNQPHLVVRKKEMYDGATPSGNAVMAENLFYLSVIFNLPAWHERAQAMVACLGQAIVKYPASFGCWASTLQNITEGLNEIAIVGSGFAELVAEVNKKYIPNKVMQSSAVDNDEYPLLKGKTGSGEHALIYFCKNYACRQPVASVEELEQLL